MEASRLEIRSFLSDCRPEGLSMVRAGSKPPGTVCGVPVEGPGKKIMSSTPVRDYWGEGGIPAQGLFRMRPVAMRWLVPRVEMDKEACGCPFCGLLAFVGRIAAAVPIVGRFRQVCRSCRVFLLFRWPMQTDGLLRLGCGCSGERRFPAFPYPFGRRLSWFLSRYSNLLGRLRFS